MFFGLTLIKLSDTIYIDIEININNFKRESRLMRGGAGRGQGNKPKPLILKRVHINIRLPQCLADKLKKYGVKYESR